MIRTRGQKDWSPNSLEKKCLRDLDSDQNWTQILKRDRPDRSSILGWAPFWRIFVINAVLFLLVLSLIFGSLEIGLGTGLAGLKEDFAAGISFVFGIAAILAFYVTLLYRRTWNRRAASISRDLDDV